MFEDYFPNQTTESLNYDITLTLPQEMNYGLYRSRPTQLCSDSSDEDN